MRKWMFLGIVVLYIVVHGFSSILNNEEGTVLLTTAEIQKEAMVNVANHLAHDFTLQSLEGKAVSLKDFRGKKVFLNFWTTWCPPCREEMPVLEKIYETYDITVIAVNITDQDRGVDVIKKFADYYHLSFPILLDEEGEVSRAYEVLTIPTSFIIDEKGRIVKEIIGPVSEKLLEEGEI